MAFKLGLRKLLLLATISTSLFSCTKDDTIKPDFVGTWGYTLDAVADDGAKGKGSVEVTFTTSSFDFTMYSIMDGDKDYTTYSNVKGSLSWSEGLLKLIPEEITVKDKKGGPTTYKKGDEKFPEIADIEFEYPSTTATYKIKGNTMTIDLVEITYILPKK